MYSKLSKFSYMGMLSNSEMFPLCEKDLEEAMEFNFLVRPTLEFSNGSSQISHSDEEDDDGDHHHQQEEERDEIEEREEKCRIEIPSLEIKIPSLGEFKNVDEEEEEEEDGLRTPTSLDQRIPLIPTCPPAPRKPKSIPLSSSSSSSSTTTTTTKRKIFLDFSKEIESLFPPSSFVADLGGGKIKKVRECH